MAEFFPTNLKFLANPLFHKGTAFSREERERYGLLGLIPPHVEDLETQLDRAYTAFESKDNQIEKYIYLRALQDTNEVLFYALIVEHLHEMMPIIYTPVVGEACRFFSEIYNHPRGLIIPYPERDNIDEILENAIIPNVSAIVVTDGERILGLGDQGAGGMGIPIGKLSLYTAAGGVAPNRTLPILLDVGTNNQERLDDPLYIGSRRERITGDEYFDFVDKFVLAVKKKWPNVLLQFEDFAQQHAGPLLNTYRDQLCTFNDDIQGTAAVTAGTLLAASKVTGVPLSQSKIVFVGAGSAGAGIAEQLIQAMISQGLPEVEARRRIFMIDKNGLLTDAMTGLLAFQTPLVRANSDVRGWSSQPDGTIGLVDVIANAKPNILIGVSGQSGLFTEEVIRLLAENANCPVVLPLSNPTSKIEAKPEDIIRWSDGRALVATGSPFDPVKYQGKTHEVAQCNNSYIFPGMGLGILASRSNRVTDKMFMTAANTLADLSPAIEDPSASLLPHLSDIRNVSKKIAFAVGMQAIADGVAADISAEEMTNAIEANFWTPKYDNLV
jgi:malate dehydrogenase (oxaloacetate-decarboxylating)